MLSLSLRLPLLTPPSVDGSRSGKDFLALSVGGGIIESNAGPHTYPS